MYPLVPSTEQIALLNYEIPRLYKETILSTSIKNITS